MRRFSVISGTVVGLLVMGVTALAVGRFVDDDGNVHEAAIEAIAAHGITHGCNPPSNSLFCPGDPVTRGQMAAFLSRALELPTPHGDYFADDAGSTFEADINRLAASGITKGCNPPANDRFCPDDVVTRGQMAAFLARGFAVASSSENTFIDDDDSVFEADIQSLASAGVTKGCNPTANDRFCPDDPVLRDQMASFLARSLELDVTPPEPAASCDFSAGSTSFDDIEVDLENDGAPETIAMSMSSSSADLVLSGDDGSFSHALTSLLSLGNVPAGSRTVSDVTGDGLPDVLACVQATPNTFYTDMVIVSAHGGIPRVVLDSSVLTRGEVVAEPGVVKMSETGSAFAGQCVWTQSTEYEWAGSIFVPTTYSVAVDTNEIEDCDPLVDQLVDNQSPSVGFVMSFTDRSVVEGETLLVEGPDAGPLVYFCEGPDSYCAPRSIDPDGQVIGYSWFVNGRSVGWDPMGLMEMSLFADGINTVTLAVIDDQSSQVTAVGYVDRQRP